MVRVCLNPEEPTFLKDFLLSFPLGRFFRVKVGFRDWGFELWVSSLEFRVYRRDSGKFIWGLPGFGKGCGWGCPGFGFTKV